MSIHRKLMQFFSIILIVTMLFSGLPSAASAQGPDGIERQVNPQTGKVSFISPENGQILSARGALGTADQPQDPAMALAKRFGPEFGLQDPARDLSQMKDSRSKNGRITTRYQQNYQGIPVMGGELIVNTNVNGDLYSMNGEVSSDLSLSTMPTISAEQVKQTALQAIAKWYQKSPKDFIASEPELWIYDESLLRPSTRPAELVWRMDVTAKNNDMPLRELVLINAQRGSISLHFNQIDTAWAVNGSSGAIQEPDPTPSPTPTETALPTETSIVSETPVPTGTPIPTETSVPTETLVLPETPTPTETVIATETLEVTPTAISTEEITPTQVVSTPDAPVDEVPTLAGAIWYVATTGNDSNSCTAPASPCATIDGAIAKAATGDIIRVASGTYTNTTGNVVTISKGITLSGGWNSAFSSQNGASIIDGGEVRNGILVNAAAGTNIVIDHFVIRNSTTGSDSGGIYLYASTLTLKNSSVINNTAGRGAGIFMIANPVLNLENTTISGNTAGASGGGLYVESGTVTINNSTVAYNHSDDVGGGITRETGSVTVLNSILAKNTATTNGIDCSGSISSNGRVLLGNTAGCTISGGSGNKLGIDPLLNSSLTGTLPLHTLQVGSPAIDAGNDQTCLAIDQRGMPRGAGCDIGAYEYAPNGGIGILSGSGQVANINSAFAAPLVVYVVDGWLNPVSGATVTFTAPVSGASGTFTNGTRSITATTNSSGQAISSLFTANAISGSYAVTATVANLSKTVNFSLTNRGPLYVATTGSDSNSCLAPASPCATINGALAKASDGDTIKIAEGTYTGSGIEVVLIEKSINLLGGWNASFTIQGGRSIIDGQGTRIGVRVNTSGATVTIDRIVVQNGFHAWGTGGLINQGNLTLSNSIVRRNTNEKTGGGGIYNYATLTINNTAIIENIAGNGGGGIYNYGALTLNNSTVSGNTLLGGLGSGIYAFNSVTLNSSTVAGNRGGDGAGISSGYFSPVILNNSTISLNERWGVYGDVISAQNTIIANNGREGDCYGKITSYGYNIIGKMSDYCKFSAATGDRIDVDPKLGELVGVLGYLPLLPGSPAIDAGNPAAPGSSNSACLAVDQRGVSRPQGSRCDIGAYEWAMPGSAASLFVVSGNGQRTIPNFAFPQPFKVAILDAQGSLVPGVEVEFTAPTSGASGSFATTGTHTVTVVSNANGIAISPALTANSQVGDYMITALASGSGSVTFNLHNGAWYVAPTGNDSNSCLSSDSPCATVNGAINKAAAGDAIAIATGTYTGTHSAGVVVIEKSITLAGGWNVDFTAQDGKSVIDGQDTRPGVAIWKADAVVVLDSFIIQNGGDPEESVGTGIINSGTLTINKTTIRNNYMGITNGGTLTLNNSTISQNTRMFGSSGSGISNGGTAYLNNSTVSGNQGGTGALYNHNTGVLVINNSTISKNQAYGIYNTRGISAGTVYLRNTILAGNGSSGDCYGTMKTQGYNLVGIKPSRCTFNATTGDLVGTSASPINPRLTLLQDNVAGTQTHALITGSPAINAGNPATPGSGGTACLAADQRGITRPVGTRCDIGAYEGAVAWAPAYRVKTYTANHRPSLPGILLCTQSNPTCALGNIRASAAHEYAIGTYTLYAQKFLRKSLDNRGMTIISTVDYRPNVNYPYDNAFWNGSQVVYGDDPDMFLVADDVVAHELTHGVTQYESNLFYYYQSGAINESLSDIWGEYYDQTNNLGNDSAQVKWLLGEDVNPSPYTLEAFRSMSNPPAYNHPDKMTSTLYCMYEGDNGCVHNNSGVNNKVAYLMVEGGSFNGKTVTALGWNKTLAIYYEANTKLLWSGADYSDLYYVVQKACSNLIGRKGITTADCTEVKDALDAVEMNRQPAKTPKAEAPLCAVGRVPKMVFADDLEAGIANWTLTNGVRRRWQLDSPYGPYAQSGKHFLYADDYPAAVTDATARLKPIKIPGKAYLHFAQAYEFEEYQGSYYDGGVLEYSTNNGTTWLDAGSLIDYNGYKSRIAVGSGNPLAGRSAFVSRSYGYISTRLNLAPLAGKTVTFRWRMGLDQAGFAWGWWVDNIKVYTCRIAKPGTFNKTAPSNGANSPSTGPTLSWGASTGAASYEYCYDTTNDNLCTNWTSNGTSRSKVLSALSAGTTYYWHVRARNRAGVTYSNGSATAFWSFTTPASP